MGFARENTRPFAAVGAAAAAATATSAVPPQDHRMRLRYVAASYSPAPTGGLLTISGLADGVVFQIDVGAAPLVLPDLDLQSAPGTAITVTLAAAGAGVVGKVNAYATFE